MALRTYFDKINKIFLIQLMLSMPNKAANKMQWQTHPRTANSVTFGVQTWKMWFRYLL